MQFFWDREGKRTTRARAGCASLQDYAGKAWGSVTIPRIGQEVLVSFLDGNPDRPIITGRVYNADQTPPYPLPAKKMVSGIKSNSTPGGGGYNEYILDDTKGNELIREHGQFDKDSTILHDLREHVKHDRHRDVTHDETILIGNDQSEIVKRDRRLEVQRDKFEKVDRNKSVQILQKNPMSRLAARCRSRSPRRSPNQWRSMARKTCRRAVQWKSRSA